VSYVFYDTETTGTDTTFDQILQFAAISTDGDLRELDRFEIRCRLLPHVIPSPGALLATRVTPQMLTDPDLPSHYEAMRRVSDKLNSWSPATFIGYNTLSFDEPLLRQAFYQTLQPVYLTNTNGNRRADVLRLVQATAVLAPNAIVVPINHKEKPTLKLDALAPANGFAHENAHDALADVEATIHMARLVRDRAPAIWAALMPLADKGDVTARVLSGKPLVLVEYHMGRPTARPVIGCAQCADNPTMLGVFDLTRDPVEIVDLDGDALVEAMRGPDRAIRTVFANRMPAVVDLRLVADLASTLGIAPETLHSRADAVMRAEAFPQRVAEALAKRYPPFEAAKIVEARIYEGFPSPADQRRMTAFHQAPPSGRAKIVETFEDDRLKELGRRLVFYEHPQALDPQRRSVLAEWIKNRRQGRADVTAGRTLADALEEIGEISASGEVGDPAICAIRNWLEGQTSE